MRYENIVKAKLSPQEVKEAIAMYVNQKSSNNPNATAKDVALYDDGEAVVTTTVNGYEVK